MLLRDVDSCFSLQSNGKRTSESTGAGLIFRIEIVQKKKKKGFMLLRHCKSEDKSVHSVYFRKVSFNTISTRSHSS